MKGNQMRKKISLAAIAALVASSVIFAGANTSANAASNRLNLVKPGSLIVGMTLQFPPQMYLDKAGKPAGYDVELVKRLAKALRLKLEIKNMDFENYFIKSVIENDKVLVYNKFEKMYYCMVIDSTSCSRSNGK